MGTLRLGGIVSGLDTNTLISQLMQIERQPIVLMQNRQHTYELKKNLWTEINTSLLAVKTKNDALLDEDNFKKRSVTTSNDAVVTATASDAAAEASYSITVTNLAQNHQIRGDQKVSTWTAGVAGSFTIKDGAPGYTTYTSTINVTSSDTLQSIADKINAAKDNTDSTKSLRITASVVDNTLMLSHDEKGTGNVISFEAASAILDDIGLVNSGTTTIKNQIQAAENATFTVNEISVTRTRNDNLTDVISGLTINLESEASAILTVTKDVDTVYNTVKEFIDQYNTTIDLINTKLSEDKVKDPLSDTDRKKGLLRGDGVLSGIKGRFRMDLSDPVDGLASAYDRLSVIGITTTSEEFGKSGKLQIDETEFKAALAADTESVVKLFTNNTDLDTDGIVEFSEKGITVRIDEELESLTSSSTTSIGGVIVKTGAILNKIDSFDALIDDYGERIADFEDRLELRETTLWRQFTDLETALSTLNNQATWLANQLAGLKNNW